jgi:2,3-dihydroxybenzoate-AMP ligase
MPRDGFVPWPRERAALYRERGYWRDRPWGSLVWDWVGRDGEKVAMVDDRRRVTYRELAAEMDAVAEHLVHLGLRAGDCVLVQLPNSIEFVTTVLACLRVGVAPTLMLMAHREQELTRIGRHVDAKAIVVKADRAGYDHKALAARVAAGCASVEHILDVDDLPTPRVGEGGDTGVEKRRARLDAQPPSPSDIAFHLLSSGTTGQPKVVARTHNDYEYSARRIAEICGFDANTVYLAVLPAAHTFCLGCPGILGTLLAGGRVVTASSPWPETAFATIARERVTVTSLVPVLAQSWVDACADTGHDLTSLRLVQVGGARPSAALVEQLPKALGCALQQNYGMSEGLINYTRLDDPPDVVAATQGRPISPGDEIRIVDPHGIPVREGNPGELQTRGPTTITGYYRAPEHNRDCFTSDGWYRTGDLVRRHPSGNLVVEGRLKDVINRGAEKINAREVEEILSSLPGIAAVAVLALPDRLLGERVCACVVLRPGHMITLGHVRAHFTASGTAAYKAPEQLEIMTALPCGPTGKVDKQALRDRLADQDTR